MNALQPLKPIPFDDKWHALLDEELIKFSSDPWEEAFQDFERINKVYQKCIRFLNQPSILLARILEPFFKEEGKPLLLRTTYHQNTDDFGVEITHLLVDKIKTDGDFSNVRTLSDLIAIVTPLGIGVTCSKLTYVRDLFKHVRGKILSPTNNQYDLVEDSNARSFNRSCYFNERSATRTQNRLLHGHGGTSNHSAISDKLLISNTFPERKISNLPFDGGNLFILTDKNNKRHLFTGKQYLYQVLFTLQVHYQNNTLPDKNGYLQNLKKVKRKTEEEIKKLTLDEKKRIIEECYALGIPIEGEAINLSFDDLSKVVVHALKNFKPSKDSNNHSVRKSGTQLKFWKSLDWNKINIREYQGFIEAYLLQKNIALEMIAEEFGCEVENIHFLPEISYHLDLFLMPGPQSSLFVQDFSLSLRVLQALSRNEEELKLTQEDKVILRRLIKATQELEDELGDLIDEIKLIVKRAGFASIPIPGMFCSYDSNLSHYANFFCGLSGWSSTTKSFFYITQGCRLGSDQNKDANKLGSYLMDAFHLFMKKTVPVLDLFYVGRNPKNSNDFSEIRNRFRNLTTISGLHCYTFPISSKDHVEKP